MEIVWMEMWAGCAVATMGTLGGIVAQCPARIVAQTMDLVFCKQVQPFVCAIQAGLETRAIRQHAPIIVTVLDNALMVHASALPGPAEWIVVAEKMSWYKEIPHSNNKKTIQYWRWWYQL